MNTTISAVSIGQAAAILQIMPGKILAAAEQLGIEPAMRLNMIAHYHESDLERISAHIRGASVPLQTRDVSDMQATVEAIRDLMDRPRINREEVARVCELGSMSMSNLPAPDETVDGVAYWRTSSIQKWLSGPTAIRIRPMQIRTE